MPESFGDAMQAWHERIKRDFAKYWWGPAVGLLITIAQGAIEHRFYAAINDYIDYHWTQRVVAVVATPEARIILSSILFVLLPLLLIVFHAYWVTRVGSKRPTFDTEIYRVVATGKGAAAEMTRDLYRVMDRLDNFAIDADILVEMYVVNTSREKHFIRDFTATVEVDGKILPLVRQSDFYAFEFSRSDYEYCLNPSEDENRFDRSELEPLQPIFPLLPIELEARKPLEGWVHFILKNVDPAKLDGNRSYKFAVVDSIGNEHPVTKASTTKRRGRITVRIIRS